MRDRVFLDSNILIYLYSQTEGDKRQIAYKVFDSYICITSFQALGEASNVWFRKSGFGGDRIREYLDNISKICRRISVVDRNTINMALSLKDRYGYAYYDSLMLASALENKCNIIFTEDMHNGQVIDDVLTITNPFG
ncbi:MAG: PIN domain-containing protein [Clostridiales bacterium]|jgi:predicted nucleic acid-binding protein|nr:PIN domain-containing protein [Clostridiales bacterium]